jgi:hypothetical protein
MNSKSILHVDFSKPPTTAFVRRVTRKCSHGRRKDRCKLCGNGSSFCSHGRRRWECRECGGTSICPHNRRRARCRDCGGVSMCRHGREKWICRPCGGRSWCMHGLLRAKCSFLECRGFLGRPGQCTDWDHRLGTSLMEQNAAVANLPATSPPPPTPSLSFPAHCFGGMHVLQSDSSPPTQVSPSEPLPLPPRHSEIRVPMPTRRVHAPVRQPEQTSLSPANLYLSDPIRRQPQRPTEQASLPKSPIATAGDAVDESIVSAPVNPNLPDLPSIAAEASAFKYSSPSAFTLFAVRRAVDSDSLAL